MPTGIKIKDEICEPIRPDRSRKISVRRNLQGKTFLIYGRVKFCKTTVPATLECLPANELGHVVSNVLGTTQGIESREEQFLAITVLLSLDKNTSSSQVPHIKKILNTSF